MVCRTFAISTGLWIPVIEQALVAGISAGVSALSLTLLGLSLFPQGIAPRDSCFRDAYGFHPGLLLFWQRLLFGFAGH